LFQPDEIKIDNKAIKEGAEEKGVTIDGCPEV